MQMWCKVLECSPTLLRVDVEGEAEAVIRIRKRNRDNFYVLDYHSQRRLLRDLLQRRPLVKRSIRDMMHGGQLRSGEKRKSVRLLRTKLDGVDWICQF